MTPEVQLALIATIVPSFAAIGALIIGWRTSSKARVIINKTDDAIGKVDSVDKKADTIIVAAEKIHSLTNSNLTKVNADLALANQRIEALQSLVTQLFADKQVLKSEIRQAGEKSE